MAKVSGGTRSGNSNNPNGVQRSSVPLSNISVSDSSYRFALGRAPRGNGNWAFSIGSREAFDDVTKAFWHNGSYTEAVKAAKKEAQKRGATTIYVMS